MKNKFFPVIFLLLALLVMTGCNNNKEKKEAVPEKEELSIKNPWIRPGAENRNSAMYFEIYNNTAKSDTLYSVESSLAKLVQIHETYNKGNDMKGMRHVDFVVIPAHTKLQFKPGGYHVMLIGLAKDLKPGDTGEATLFFKLNGKVQVRAEVKGK